MALSFRKKDRWQPYRFLRTATAVALLLSLQPPIASPAFAIASKADGEASIPSVVNKHSVAKAAATAVKVNAPTAASANNAAPIVGNPPIDRFVPDIDVFPQHFCVAQDSAGIVYIGTTGGVLEFDGEQWRLIALPNGELVRSLAVAADGRIYVGGFNYFGYLQRDKNGKNSFKDLTPLFRDRINQAGGGDAKVAREFTDIWETLVTPEGVYFRALNDVFLWSPADNSTMHWYDEQKFGLIIRHNEKTFLQFRGEGVKIRVGSKGDNNDWQLIAASKILTNLVHIWVPLSDGGLLGAAADGKWWRLDETTLSPAKLPANMPVATNFSRGIALSDGTIGLLSAEGTLYIMDGNLQVRRQINVESGYLTSIYQGVNNALLVLSEEVLYKIRWPTEWSVLGSENGVTSNISQLAEWRGERYLLTSAGMMRAKIEAGSVQFLPVKWGDTNGYDLLGIDSHRALLAGAHHLMLIETRRAGSSSPDVATGAAGKISTQATGGTTRQVSTDLLYPRLFTRSRFRPNHIFMGTDDGLRSIFIGGAKFAVRQGAVASPISAFADIQVSPPAQDDLKGSVTNVAEVSAEELWVGTARHGAWRYRFSTDGEMIGSRRFDEKDGLKVGQIANAEVSLLPNGMVVASTRAGLFGLEGEKFSPINLGNLAALRGATETFTFVSTIDGEKNKILWAYSDSRVLQQMADGNWRVHDIRALKRGAINSHFVDSVGNIIFMSTNSLLLHSRINQAKPTASIPPMLPLPPMPIAGEMPHSVVLRGVTQIFADGTEVQQPINPDRPLQFSSGDFSLRFDFSLPELARNGIKRYQGRMVGIEDAMSGWTSSHTYTYSAFKPGDYTMRIRAKDSLERESETSPYKFEVMPAWHATLLARTLTLLALLALGWLLVLIVARRRTTRFESANLELENKVAERTRELADANRRLELIAHIDGLTGISNRRRVDGYLDAVWLSCREQQRPLSILMIDVDHFKQYNDTHGHLAGDELLKRVAQTLLRCLRRSEDLLARYGGEEFLVVLPGANAKIAQNMAETMRDAVDRSALAITVSVGIGSRIPDDEGPFDLLIAEADQALYAAKRGGRNKVHMGAGSQIDNAA